MVTIQVRNKKLLKDNKEYDITKDEIRLLLLLSDGQVHTKEEILNYMKISDNAFVWLRNKFWRRYNLGMHYRKKIGYKLGYALYIDD